VIDEGSLFTAAGGNYNGEGEIIAEENLENKIIRFKARA